MNHQRGREREREIKAREGTGKGRERMGTDTVGERADGNGGMAKRLQREGGGGQRHEWNERVGREMDGDRLERGG